MNEIRVTSDGTLEFLGKTYQCALGKQGVTDDKREGDLKTPLGSFLLRECYYRADRIDIPETGLATHIIHPNDGWCDDSSYPEYNRKILLPFTGSHEKLWRDEMVYDIIVPLGYNDNPPVPGKGSAIFMHIAREGYMGTEGCVALALPHLLEILPKLSSQTRIVIKKSL